MRRTSIGVLAALSLLLAPARAAFAGTNGDPIDTTPRLLPPGQVYGSVPDHPDQTQVAAGKNSGHAECGASEGASAYVFTVAAGTHLSLSVTDDVAGQSVCGIELFSKHSGSNTLGSLYTGPNRDSFRVGSFDTCLLSASTCGFERVTPWDDTYYLVFWPADSGSGSTATFHFSAGLLRKTTTALWVYDQYTRANGCFKVHLGRSFDAVATLSPSDSAGTVRFRLERLISGVYQPADTFDRALSQAKATLHDYLRPFGRYRINASYLGNVAAAPSVSPWRCIDIVTGSTVTLALTQYYGTISDYKKYHDNQTFPATATIKQAPASGKVHFRFEREITGGDVPVYVYERTLSNSTSMLMLKLHMRHTYYRIRAEYAGDALHMPGISPWECIQLTG